MTSEYDDLKKLFYDFQPFSKERLDQWCQKCRILELTTPGFKQGLEPIYVELKNLHYQLIQLNSLFQVNDRAREANLAFPKDGSDQQIQAWIEKYEEQVEQVEDANLDILEIHSINEEEKSVLFTKEYGYHTNVPENSPPTSSDWGEWIVTHKITFTSELDPIQETITFCELFWDTAVNH
jgi:hypothetical protein